MKRDLPAYVERRKGRKGQVYLYFRRGKGPTIRMHAAAGTPDFAAEYAKLIRGVAPVPVGKSLRALIASYKRDDRYGRLKPRTRADYDKVLAFLDDRMGDLPADKMRRKDVVRLRDSNEGRFATYCVQVVRILMEHAMDQGWRDDNPARGVGAKRTEAAPRYPWPADMVAAYRDAADGRALLLFELLLGTGQRIGDVLRMRWGDLSDGGISVRQSKTGAALWIPLPPRVTALLASTPRRGLTIVAQDDGRPVSYRAAAHAISQVRKQIGAGAGYDIHALRHTAAADMAARGLDDDHIASVTGHKSRAMVARYSGAARQRARATKAQEGRE